MPGVPPRILVCDELAPQALGVFRARGLEAEVRTGLAEADLVALVPGFHALVVRSATTVTRAVIEAGSDLRVVARAGVGTDNVDTDAATERGIVVMNTPSGNTTTTAELALALLFALARHVPRADRRARERSWSRKDLVGVELAGKRLGVVGLGRIGRLVAERALGLRMSVVAADPLLPRGASPVAGVELVDLDELLAQCDFVTLHVPLDEGTRNLLSRERLARMKRGARLVNTARGGLVDEAALRDALESGRLAGAALDVLEQEPPPAGHPLLGREDVILTPHLGASSREAQIAVAVDVARQVCDFLLEGVAHNAVNAPATSPATLREIGPYVLLAEKLGSLLAQLLRGPVRRVELTLSGAIAREDHRHVPLALLCGLLRHGSDAGVNFVNAPVLARERGLRLLEALEEDAHPFASLVEARVHSDEGVAGHVAAGTVFGRAPRVVRLDGLEIDLDPRGRILFTRHADRPGVVGLLGTELGALGVNIRRVELGPADGSGDAIGLLSLDGEPPADLAPRVQALDPVREARLLRF